MIETLIKLEPKFFEAGELALRLQKNIKLNKKSNTGNKWGDAITKADFQVQEFLLKEMAKTKLTNCRLLAEEETPSATKFNSKGKLFLNIDPIDGTFVYASKKPFFSTIVGLHDGKNILYTFKYHPALKWGHIIFGKKCKTIGQIPKLNLLIKKQKVITYISNPAQHIPLLYKELKNQGYEFVFRNELGHNIGGTTMLLSGQVKGLFQLNPNAYDGLVALHYAQAKNYKIYQGPNNKFDISKTKKTKFGEVYQGWYLVLNK